MKKVISTAALIILILLLTLCCISVVKAGPNISFNFGVDKHPYRYYEPVPPPAYGWYDRYGNFHPYGYYYPPPRYREYRGYYYGPSVDLRLRSR